MPKGRPFEAGNKFGRGRPPGSRNKRTLIAQDLLDSHAEPIMRQALVVALKGDVQMLRVLLSHILPRRKIPLAKIGPLPTGTAQELSQSSEKLMKKVGAGKISTGDALEVFTLMEHRRKMIESESFEARLAILEKRAIEINGLGE